MPLEIPNQDGLNRGPDPFQRPWERTAVQHGDAEAMAGALGIGKNTVVAAILIKNAEDAREVSSLREKLSPIPMTGCDNPI